MRVLGNLPFVKELAAKFPFGATIQNETDTQDGTPVVRELYGDILMNMYRLLTLTGITPNGTEDSTDTSFQIVNALKRLPNEINDTLRILDLNGTTFETDLDFSILPNGFIFFAVAAEDYDKSVTYTFKGTGVTTYPFSSAGFKASDDLMIIADFSGVRAVSLTPLAGIPETVFTTLGNPLAYNELPQMMYFESGNILTDLPSVDNLESIIRVDQSDGTLVVTDIFLLKGHFMCATIKPSDPSYYKIFCFDANDTATVIEFAILGNALFNYETPHIYTDGNFLYVTNEFGGTSADNEVSKYTFDEVNKEVVFVSTVTLDASFVKTSNAVVKNDSIYTFVTSNFDKFDLITGIKTSLGTFDGVNGQLFMLGGGVYFGSGEVATKWTI